MGEIAKPFQLSLHDKKLLELAQAGMSGVEMEQETGIPAAKAIGRIKEILESHDTWSDSERQQLILHDLYRLRTRALNYLSEAEKEDRVTPRTLEVVSGILRDLGDRLDKIKTYNDEEEEKIAKQQAKMVLAFVEDAWVAVRKTIDDKHKRGALLSATEADDVFYGALRTAYDNQIING